MQLTKLVAAAAASAAIVHARPTGPQDVNVAELSGKADVALSNIFDVLYGGDNANGVDANQRYPSAGPNGTNSSAPAFPNWEGAIIGAGMAAQLGALIGAALGVFSSWTFVGFQKGLTDLFGFDPLAALASGTLPIPGLDAGSLGKGGKGGLPPLPPSLGSLTAPTPLPPAKAPPGLPIPAPPPKPAKGPAPPVPGLPIPPKATGLPKVTSLPSPAPLPKVTPLPMAMPMPAKGPKF
jgi:hypothetical protein